MGNKAISNLLGNKRSSDNLVINSMANEMSGILGINVKAEDGKGSYRTDRNGVLWISDVDDDESKLGREEW